MFRDEYDWDQCSGTLLDRCSLFLCGPPSGDREAFFVNTFALDSPQTTRMRVEFSDLETCRVEVVRPSRTVEGGGPIQTAIKSVLSERALLRCVVLDITSLQHPATMYIVKLLSDLGPGELFAVYAEPLRYRRLHNGDYNLSTKFLGDKAVPGFARQARTDTDKLLCFMGFEGGRLSKLLDDRTSVKSVIPVIGFPSYQPGWNLSSLASSGRILTRVDALFDIRTCPASSVFEALKVLDDVSNNVDSQHIIVAPLGTRPHTLATALYAASNRRIMIAYDHPEESRSRSIDVGRKHVYHLSGLLR